MTAQHLTLHIFLDDGGVMSDNARRRLQWQHLVAEFFVPLLGGDAARWAEANLVVAERLYAPAALTERWQAASNDYHAMDRATQITWLRDMCALIGATPPADDNVCEALARQATAWVTRRIDAAFPDVVQAIRDLHQRSFPLHTASGESSLDLTGYLEGIGIRAYFDHLYGPDLISCAKESPDYYQRLLDDAGIAPQHALIVDDSPRAVGWAAGVGAHTVLVCRVPQQAPPGTHAISSLAELPALADRLAHS